MNDSEPQETHHLRRDPDRDKAGVPAYAMLDYGYVACVNHMGDDDEALRAARLSTDRETGVDAAADHRLRDYLWRNQHTTPFEQCELVVELQLPIFCLRQLDRHRTVMRDETGLEVVVETLDETMHAHTTRNEFSGRYSKMPDLFYVPLPERVKSKGRTNKQGSAEALAKLVQDAWHSEWAEEARHDREIYERAVGAGMASELARVHLPLNQYTRVRLKACLLNWFKFLNLRLRPDVQWETRLYAQAIGRICQQLWPETWAVFEEHSLYGARLSRTERRLARDAIEMALENIAGTSADVEDVRALLARLADPPDLLSAE